MSVDGPIIVRSERVEDREAIARVHEEAFGRAAEAALVAALRDVARPYVARVATVGGRVVGHVALSPVTIGAATAAGMGLGPIAVRPAHQRRGIGAALVRDGLARCAEAACSLVFVLGDPRYYRRFGFVPAPPLGLRYRAPEFDAAFMVIELTPGALERCARGFVEYLPAFGRVDDG